MAAAPAGSCFINSVWRGVGKNILLQSILVPLQRIRPAIYNMINIPGTSLPALHSALSSINQFSTQASGHQAIIDFQPGISRLHYSFAKLEKWAIYDLFIFIAPACNCQTWRRNQYLNNEHCIKYLYHHFHCFVK